MRCYPRNVRIVGACFAGGLVLLVIVGWVTLPMHLKQQFTPFQLITLLAVLAAIVTVIVALGASTVRADATGVLVRNGFRTHRLSWSQIRRVNYRDGDPWAVAVVERGDVADEEDVQRLGLMGIQRSDGTRAAHAVAQLRKLRAAAEADRIGPASGR